MLQAQEKSPTFAECCSTFNKREAKETFLAITFSAWTGGFLALADNLITSDTGVTSGTKEPACLMVKIQDVVCFFQ